MSLADEHVEDKKLSVRKYLSVIDATCTSILQEAQPFLLVALVERFKGAMEIMNSWKERRNSQTSVGGTSHNFDLCYW